MSIDNLKDDLKTAMLAKTPVKVSVLRMLLSELNYAKIQKGGDLEDAEVTNVVQKEVKKRREAAAGFRSGGREESAKKEEDEAEILSAYLPAQLSDDDLGKIIDDVISQTGASGVTDMGRVIGVVMGKVAGTAEGERVSMLVKERLTK